jgi:hypothetical protein
MTQGGRTPERQRTEQALRMALLGVIGQVGCLTLLIILVALIAGLWLDGQFHTRPLLTLLLMLGSVPVTLFLMFRIVLSTAPKLQAVAGQDEQTTSEEEPEGGERSSD